MLLGWDTDEFPTNVLDVTLAMYEILENGGIAPGGINLMRRYAVLRLKWKICC
ncbi:hypothetical protein [Listeria aquatica]|uniref:hypothetical protein n=1 Tax=Listeria aquatica TaxID=1494960 RepID=UPI0031F57EE6